MTDKEKAIVMAYTGFCMLTGDKFQIFHKYVEDIMGRPIMTHEMGRLEDVIREKSKEDFIKLCKSETGQIKSLDDIKAYLIENVFRNPDIMFSEDREKIDLPEIIASLYECLHITITGEPYLYMFHWANKIGSDVDDQLFVEPQESEDKNEKEIL